MDNLIQIRCPIKRRGKDNKIYICNSVCVKVKPGSAGEVRCRRCQMDFEFIVDSQAQDITGVHRGVRVKQYDE